jgi:hypothetical protein
MSSAAKLAANRANAQHSTGPRTEEGKDRSRLNGLSHGLTSKAAFLPWENHEAYEALHAAFDRDYNPAGDLESELLRAMADAWWRLDRARRMETEFLINREGAIRESGVSASGDEALVLLFTDPEQMKKMRLMMRYTASAEKAWNKAQSDFDKARAERMQREREQAAVELSGFASQPVLSAEEREARMAAASATVEKWIASASSSPAAPSTKSTTRSQESSTSGTPTSPKCSNLAAAASTSNSAH